MDIFQGKVYRYVIFTIGTYATLSFLAPKIPNEVVQQPKNEQGIESIMSKDKSGKGIENKMEQQEKELKQDRQKPSDKYGPQWQEEIRRNYRTELA